MPPGAKKRKAAKKKQQQQQQASSTQTNHLMPTNHESKEKELGLDTDERIEITDSSRDHDKNSSTSSSSSSSSSDDESSEVNKKKESDESVSEAVTVSSSVPNQAIPIAGDAPFMGTTANVIVESIGLMDDSAAPSDPNTENLIEIAPVDTIISNESSLPKPNEITALASDEVKQASSSVTTTFEKKIEGKTSTLVPEGSKESEATISHVEEEAPVRPTHGVAQRTSWLSCCGLFDAVTGSSR